MADRSGYEEVRTCVAAVFNLEARLPDMVFRNPSKSTLFCEFEAVLGVDFWPALCALAQLHGDDWIHLLVLDPDGDSYYVPEYNMYPAASIATTSSMDEYWELISEEPSGDVTGAIVFSAEVIALTGVSGKWGCWGERSIGVAAIQGVPADGWREKYGPLLTVNDALRQYITPNFRKLGVPGEFASALTTNYAP
ncbi:hypothetical protein AB0K21_31200 [Streptosporangium sp. NPDC049248]|uniref:hypothetical protein n=1 Tax=Streptosporangium sp. NPDC049248 TaxID=3155651 RepID=UPI00342D3A61